MIMELTHIADISSHLAQETEVFVVYDRNVEWVVKDLSWPALSLDTSEDGKTLETVQDICRWLLECGASRHAFLLAIGGGITTDLAGFAAAIYKRGIRYANLPTTLLAQVDAAIGGKTGVNMDGYKNMLGAFHMPEFTFICADVLRTLPDRILKAGLAEMLKTFLLADGEAYRQALSGISQELILKAGRIKEAVVSRDPFEQGERAKLNLGHTFGHAIEHEARQRADDISHGEAVAMGIILAARLSESLGIGQKGLTARLKKDFQGIGLPVECPYPTEILQEAMAKDKKALGGGKVKFVLPVKPGEVVFHEMNPYDLHFDTK